mgnify:CR=1 FL=1|jgi:hypothetical protein
MQKSEEYEDIQEENQNSRFKHIQISAKDAFAEFDDIPDFEVDNKEETKN